ncbi:divalent-cation tolerance protein CutA [Reyranella sp.]|jgi:periplasmic divalent cation tolerance protein|uniref:divalent-cation tolerance protein CutA n=1 Tax=Reyranella sp. TaxID=1929291 RepID=UPI002F923DE7
MTAIAVVTTVSSKKEARRMAHALVEAGLAACAQISRIDSVYAWKGAIEHGKEYRVLFKTTVERYGAIEHAIRDLHSYELPAIHAFAFAHISAPYADWIESNTR